MTHFQRRQKGYHRQKRKRTLSAKKETALITDNNYYYLLLTGTGLAQALTLGIFTSMAEPTETERASTPVSVSVWLVEAEE